MSLRSRPSYLAVRSSPRISPEEADASELAAPRIRAVRSQRRSFRAVATVLGLVAALAYCSWPVGYLVNPTLAASALASELEASGQPYSWLFTSLDCATGLVALVVALLLWPQRRASNSVLQRVALVGYGLFGVITAIDAVIPVGCGGLPLNRCGVDLSRLNPDDMLTGIAMIALFVAAVCAQVHSTRQVAWHPLSISSLVIVLGWSACGLVFLAASFSYRPAVPLQHLTLALTSAVVFVVPALCAFIWSRSRIKDY